MYYQITEEDVYTNEKALICLGNEKAIIAFVNERNEGADKLLDNIGDAIDWLEDNGYEVERRKNLIERLEKGEVIFFQ